MMRVLSVATRPLLLLATLGLSACSMWPVNQGKTSDAAFADYSTRFVQDLMAHNPDWAIYAGLYDQAEQLSVPDAAGRAEDVAFINKHLAALQQFDAAALPADQRVDHEMIRRYLEGQRWRAQVLRKWQWDPSQYNVANGFALLLDTDYAPEDERLRTISIRLTHIPDYYAAAQANITQPTREHVQLAIQQNTGALSVFDESLEQRIDDSGLSVDEKAQMKTHLIAARVAIQDYIAWLSELEPTLTPDNSRDFRLGAELYEPLFTHQIQSGYPSARALYERAIDEKERLHTKMTAQAKILWPKLFGERPLPDDRVQMIGEVIAELSKTHASIDSFVGEVRRQIRELEAFVLEKQLVDMDPDKPLVVRETPPYQRGVAIASIDAPGPFNPDARTYYNVTPLDRFTAEQAESFLREYNHWVLQVLNIHEAIPGHYTQLIHANRSPSKIKSLLGNGAMIEGWAVYSERMMLENGWGMDAPEMWLLYGKWNLRVVCNTILDYGVHVLGMSEAEALDLLMREAFQTETEARGKWRRVQLTQVQLTSYFSGYAEIYDFREQLRREKGEDFDLRRFHNQFLSYGSAPVGLIKQLMREDG